MPGLVQRPPHPDIKAWSPSGYMTAVTAQLLYINGLLEYPVDLESFSRLIGQHPLMIQDPTGWLEHLLEERFIVETVCPYDPERMQDIGYCRDILRGEGWAESDVEDYGAEQHKPLADQAASWLKLVSRYKSQFIISYERTSWATVDELLEKGCVVEISLRTPTPSVGEPVLVTEGNGLFYTIYQAGAGVSRAKVDGYFTDHMLQGVVGYRLG